MSAFVFNVNNYKSKIVGLDVVEGDTRYVNASGDSMTGSLSVPIIYNGNYISFQDGSIQNTAYIPYDFDRSLILDTPNVFTETNSFSKSIILQNEVSQSSLKQILDILSINNINGKIYFKTTNAGQIIISNDNIEGINELKCSSVKFADNTVLSSASVPFNKNVILQSDNTFTQNNIFNQTIKTPSITFNDNTVLSSVPTPFDKNTILQQQNTFTNANTFNQTVRVSSITFQDNTVLSSVPSASIPFDKNEILQQPNTFTQNNIFNQTIKTPSITFNDNTVISSAAVSASSVGPANPFSDASGSQRSPDPDRRRNGSGGSPLDLRRFRSSDQYKEPNRQQGQRSPPRVLL